MASKDNHFDLVNLLKDYRRQYGVTQQDIATKLGVSQAHIARFESGRSVSLELQRQIQAMIGIQDDVGLSPVFKSEVLEEPEWRICLFSYKQSGGDRAWISNKISKERSLLFLCDAAGSDKRAELAADYFTIAFESSLTMLNPLALNLETLCLSIDQTIKRTKRYWRGNPSVVLCMLEKRGKRFTYVNCGMPDTYLFKRREKGLNQNQDTKVPPIGDFPQDQAITSQILEMDSGDMFMSFSDGFVEEFKAYSEQPLEKQLTAIAKAQRGDAEGVGQKLLKNFEKSLRGRILKDNISFLFVSKR